MKLARQKPRYGYRRLHALLSRRGHEVNVKRIYRLYVEERLMVRRKRRKRLVRERVGESRLTGANQEWAMDFIVDGLATGRMVRILSVVDAYTRECLALEADTSLGGTAYAIHRPDLAPVFAAMVVGLHFLPLGKIFRQARYYGWGAAIALWCTICAFSFRSNTLVAWNFNFTPDNSGWWWVTGNRRTGIHSHPVRLTAISAFCGCLWEARTWGRELSLSGQGRSALHR